MENINFPGMTIGMVDERGEIAAMYKGVPQNDVGIRTDILDNIPKTVGMKMLIRSMSPSIITADEIGTKEEIEAIEEAIKSGVKGIFTAHGSTIEDIKHIADTYIFEKIIFLGTKKCRGEIEKVYTINKINGEYVLFS